MEWEKRLKELNGYNISFEIKQGYYHIALTFDDGWNILTPENEFIYVEERNNVYHYIASTDNVKIEDMFNAIDATIDFNMDLQKKWYCHFCTKQLNLLQRGKLHLFLIRKY